MEVQTMDDNVEEQYHSNGLMTSDYLAQNVILLMIICIWHH
jgi:hypothetical protein